MKITDKLKAWALGQFAGRVLKASAEGKYGKAPQWLYWHLSGIKTVLGASLAIATAALVIADKSGVCALAGVHWTWVNCTAWTENLAWATGAASAFFVWLGQVDGSLNLGPPLALSIPNLNARAAVGAPLKIPEIGQGAQNLTIAMQNVVHEAAAVDAKAVVAAKAAAVATPAVAK